MGDKVTALLEKTIMLNLEEDDSAINMGEEGILVVFNKAEYKTRCEMINASFQKQVKEFYSPEDTENGYIQVTRKEGEPKKYPIVRVKPSRVV